MEDDKVLSEVVDFATSYSDEALKYFEHINWNYDAYASPSELHAELECAKYQIEQDMQGSNDFDSMGLDSENKDFIESITGGFEDSFSGGFVYDCNDSFIQDSTFGDTSDTNSWDSSNNHNIDDMFKI